MLHSWFGSAIEARSLYDFAAKAETVMTTSARYADMRGDHFLRLHGLTYCAEGLAAPHDPRSVQLASWF
jgi:hypothetical protein